MPRRKGSAYPGDIIQYTPNQRTTVTVTKTPDTRPRHDNRLIEALQKELSRKEKLLEHQAAEFACLKDRLMGELQDRTDYISQLENAERMTQKKIAHLEENIKQMTVVSGALIEQNHNLKAEAEDMGRAVAARDERINALEGLLHESHDMLEGANDRFHRQLVTMKRQLGAPRLDPPNRPSVPSQQPRVGTARSTGR